jgi:hypothetical protein
MIEAMLPEITVNIMNLKSKAGICSKAIRRDESNPNAMISKTIRKENIPKLEIKPWDNLSGKLLKAIIPFSRIEDRIRDPTKVAINEKIKRLRIVRIAPSENILIPTPVI